MKTCQFSVRLACTFLFLVYFTFACESRDTNPVQSEDLTAQVTATMESARTPTNILPSLPSPTAVTPVQTNTPDRQPTETSLNPIRPSVLAGEWYTADENKLASNIDSFLSVAESFDGTPLALFVPNANYDASGHVMAAAYRQMENGQYDSAIILVADYELPTANPVSILKEGGFQTPLGIVAVDSELAEMLLAADENIHSDETSFEKESAIEIQLPFLQRVCTQCKIVPVLVGVNDDAIVELVSKAIFETLQTTQKRVVLIAASNLSQNAKQEDAMLVDNATLAAMESGNPQALRDAIKKYTKSRIPDLETAMYGEAPVLIAMKTAQEMGADTTTLLYYANSADAPDGDPKHVSGYGSVMFWKYSAPELDAESRQTLLMLARNAIAQYLKINDTPVPVENLDKEMMRKAGIFVTIKKKGELRGSIGHLWADQPIAESVQEMAVAAATSDPRFPRMTAEELAQSKIEITILSPLRRVTDVNTIQVGVHGLYIKYKGRQSVILPQTAVELNWGRPRFLDSLCTRSGLPAGCWKDSSSLYSFTTFMFAEE